MSYTSLQTSPWGYAIACLIALSMFGYLYNRFVTWLKANDYDQGYMSFIVALGIVVTILPIIPIIGTTSTLYVLAAFIASGTPMIIGSIHRHITARKAVETKCWKDTREAIQFNDQETRAP